MYLFHTHEVNGDQCFLTNDEHRHCIKVLRKRIGDIITATDGKGSKYTLRISQINKTKTELDILGHVTVPSSKFSLHVAVALPKSSNRVDFLLEKLVETGTQEITPLVSAHSVRKSLNIERYRKKLISAATQSLKYHFPILNESQTLQSFLAAPTDKTTLIAHYDAANMHLSDVIKDHKDIRIIVGPEGDFSESELRQFSSKGHQLVNLSLHRLRTETAAIAASIIYNCQL